MTKCLFEPRGNGLFNWVGHCIVHDFPAPCRTTFDDADEATSVDHPDHYGGDTTYETIKVIEAWGLGFHLGNTVKYLSRAGRKDPSKLLEDLEKALWYLQRFIEQVKADGRE